MRPRAPSKSAGLHYQIYTNDNAREAAQYRDLIIATRNGGIIRLSDVAQVLDKQDGATENRRTYGIYNGKAAITVQVFQQPGANIVEVVDAVKKELPELKAEIDPKIDLEVIQDRSITIRGSLHQVEQTLVIAVLMVILVVYIFLNSFRAALIPAVVVPVSLTGHLRHHVSGRVQPGQLLADGHDHRHRIRGGRCHRGDGELHPPHRERR